MGRMNRRDAETQRRKEEKGEEGRMNLRDFMKTITDCFPSTLLRTTRHFVPRKINFHPLKDLLSIIEMTSLGSGLTFLFSIRKLYQKK